ncbi:MAG TPA: type II secretion system F family protein [Candidatus Ozemobacteraceae bacterium]|nr:type II secretion system F family protein [Candidatus Ozemobacteraceae bacterium]
MTDIRNFFLQLETSLGSGIAITRALQLISKNLSGSLRRKVEAMGQAIEHGSTFSDAMARAGRPFEKMHISFIRFGEQSGNLDKVCGALARHAEKEVAVSRKVINSMLYPGFVLLFAICMGPILEVILAGKPYSDGFPGAAMNAGIFAVVVGGFYGLYASGVFSFLDAIVIHLPFLGGILEKLALARFTRALAVGESAGVPLVEALNTAIDVSANGYIQKQLSHLPRHVGGGKGISSGLEHVTCLPGTLKEMIMVGEQSGKLSEMLEKTAVYFEEEANNRIDGLMKVLPALFFLAVALYVGSMIIPIAKNVFEGGMGALNK